MNDTADEICLYECESRLFYFQIHKPRIKPMEAKFNILSHFTQGTLPGLQETGPKVAQMPSLMPMGVTGHEEPDFE